MQEKWGQATLFTPAARPLAARRGGPATNVTRTLNMPAPNTSPVAVPSPALPARKLATDYFCGHTKPPCMARRHVLYS